MRCHRLANGANIVALALHREEHGLADRIRVDALAVPFQPTERERMVLKDELHRLEVEFRREIEHGKIFVVERPGYFGLFEFAVCEIFIKLPVCLDVPFNIHAHERDELDETRTDPAKGTGVAQWHGS